MDKKQQDPALEQILDELDSGGTPRPAEPSVRQEQPTKVRFLHSETEQMPMRVNVPSGQRQETPQPQPVRNFSDDSPKIRRMSDSTRAREIEKIKKENKKNLNRSSDLQEEQTYARERPEGDYMYTQIHGVKRAQKRKKVKRTPDLTAAGTETIQLNVKDIVNVRKLPEPEPVQPVEIKPAPRAEKTSLDLTMPLDREEIDVAIRRSKEEAEELNKRQREFQSKMELRSISDIRGDIDELRSAMVFRIFADAAADDGDRAVPARRRRRDRVYARDAERSAPSGDVSGGYRQPRRCRLCELHAGDARQCRAVRHP